MNKEEKTPEEIAEEKEQKEIEKLRKQGKIKLSGGKIGEVKELNGAHALDAQSRCEGDQKKYASIILSEAVTIDGKTILPEDWHTVPIRDFNSIFALHSELNF